LTASAGVEAFFLPRLIGAAVGTLGIQVWWFTAEFVTGAAISGQADYSTGSEWNDETGEYVFIHSIGPVCYNTLSQLTRNQGRQIVSYCRHNICCTEDDYDKEICKKDSQVPPGAGSF